MEQITIILFLRFLHLTTKYQCRLKTCQDWITGWGCLTVVEESSLKRNIEMCTRIPLQGLFRDAVCTELPYTYIQSFVYASLFVFIMARCTIESLVFIYENGKQKPEKAPICYIHLCGLSEKGRCFIISLYNTTQKSF